MAPDYLTCPMCGFEFERTDTLCAHGCPLGSLCHLVRCPACEYEFPETPPTVSFVKRLFRKRLPTVAGLPPGVRTAAELRPGETATVLCLGSTVTDRHRTLTVYGLGPDAEITLVQHQPACVIRIGETELAIDAEIARDILVQPLESRPESTQEPAGEPSTVESRARAEPRRGGVGCFFGGIAGAGGPPLMSRTGEMSWHTLTIIQSGLGDALASQPLLALGILFGAGVLTSLTPCIYPMIPITVGVISGSAGDDAPRSRVIGLTLAYVTGLALLYAVAGLIAGMTGQLFGSLAASVWARLLVAALLALFGLAMLDVFPVSAPRRLVEWAGSLRGGSYPAVFALGATSGLVAAPCGAPAFAAVLTWVSTTGSAWLGFLYLFVFALGMTALLFVVGVSSGAASRLPRAGTWTIWVKRGAGVLLLLMACYYVYQAWLVW